MASQELSACEVFCRHWKRGHVQSVGSCGVKQSYPGGTGSTGSTLASGQSLHLFVQSPQMEARPPQAGQKHWGMSTARGRIPPGTEWRGAEPPSSFSPQVCSLEHTLHTGLSTHLVQRARQSIFPALWAVQPLPATQLCFCGGKAAVDETYTNPWDCIPIKPCSQTQVAGQISRGLQPAAVASIPV